MTTNQIVYLMIGSLSVITCLFMFMILFIGRLEMNNSKRKLNMDLILMYSHRFYKMYGVFNRYKIEYSENLFEMYYNNEKKFKESRLELAPHIHKNCMHNKYVFIDNLELRSKLKTHSTELSEVYQEWLDNLIKLENVVKIMKIKGLEDKTYFASLMQTHLAKYEKMVYLVKNLKNNLTNESLEAILRIK